jgi:2-polyprenyl-3-methyl-5-hydroxy-6-metoxy-1,4-benzoquinol methylase
MLEALEDEGATLTGTLVHATFSPLDVPFRDEIDKHARRAGLRLVRKQGPVDEALLQALAAEIAAPIWYVAGPVEDVKHTRALLVAMGIREEDIRLEAFRYTGSLAAPTLPPGLPNWNEVYQTAAGEHMPWYYPELDPDVARAIDAYALRGRALDVGTGPGTQAIALAERGFETTGTDISPAAVEAARKRDAKGRVRFLVDDVLASGLEEQFDVVFDRGCFHVIPAARRGDYVRAIAARVAPGGTLLLKCFADDQPGDRGPSRFSPDDIVGLFGDTFAIREISRTIYHGTLEPPPRALFCVLSPEAQR